MNILIRICRDSHVLVIITTNFLVKKILPSFSVSSSRLFDLLFSVFKDDSEILGTEEFERRNLVLLNFWRDGVSFSFDVLFFCSLSADKWSRFVLLWLRFWLVVVEDPEEVDGVGLVILLCRLRERDKVEAIGKSSVLWLLDEVTDLGLDKDGDNVETLLSDGFEEELCFWLILRWSFGGDKAVGDCSGEEEDDEDERESPNDECPVLFFSLGNFKVTFEMVLSRGPVCPRPGPPRRLGAAEVDDPERFVEARFWLDWFRDGIDGNLLD